MIQRYAWGSRQILAELLGRPAPSPDPEAELWLGAHPRGPALVEQDGDWKPLDGLLEEAPEFWLGARGVAAYGPRLPFLLKVLAVAQPLSLQTHPDEKRAARVFEAQRHLAPAEQTYGDPHGKPELVCALARFEALCGVRPLVEIRTWLDEAGLADLVPLESGESGEGAIAALLAGWLRRSGAARSEPLGRLRAHAERRAAADPVARRICELAAFWPDDPGLLAPVLLHSVTLEPGEALFLPPGVLHCYLSGAAIEIMAASDNVVRAGLTPKKIHVEELLAVSRFEPHRPPVLTAEGDDAGPLVYRTPAAEFELARLEPRESGALRLGVHGPEILLCTAGAVEVQTGDRAIALARGESCLLPAGIDSCAVSGHGTLFRARSGTAG